MRELMSTKEVAEYLGIHEKQVYALAKRGAIPCTRVTGKWLFPRKLIDQWIEDSARGKPRDREHTERPFVLVAGSDDPSLGLLRQCYSRRTATHALFLATVGSRGGLDALQQGMADVALTHLMDPVSGEYNLSYVRQFVPATAAVVTLFHRQLGLLVPLGNPLGLRTLADMGRPGVRLMNRQEGSGTRWYLDHELARLGLEAWRIEGYENTVATHLDVGLQVLRGQADTGMATQATAHLLGLDFVPLVQERFDMVIAPQRFFRSGVQTLLDVVGSRDFRTRLEALGGYDTQASGRLRAS